MRINLDLDTNTCNAVKLGEIVSNPALLKGVGFTVYTRSNIISGLHISSNNLEPQIFLTFPKPTGTIVRRGINIYDSQTKLTPEDVLALYSKPKSHWDDESEVNYQFSEGGIHTEYSWYYGDDGLDFNYISIELEDLNLANKLQQSNR